MIEKIIEFPENIEITCPSCNSTNVSTKRLNESFIYGANKGNQVELNVNIPVRICNDCNQEFEDDEAEELRHNEVCRYLKRLNPERVINIRHKYGLTRKQFSEITSIGEASLARWETGGLIQNSANDKYLRLLEIEDNFKIISKDIYDQLISNKINEDKSFQLTLGKKPTTLNEISIREYNFSAEAIDKGRVMYRAIAEYGIFSCV